MCGWMTAASESLLLNFGLRPCWKSAWREVFEHNPVMYFVVSLTGAVRSVNGFDDAKLGYTAAELVGQSVLNVFFASKGSRRGSTFFTSANAADNRLSAAPNEPRGAAFRLALPVEEKSFEALQQRAPSRYRPGLDALYRAPSERLASLYSSITATSCSAG